MAAADVMTARRRTIAAVVAAGMVAAGMVAAGIVMVFDTGVTVVMMLSARRRSQAKAPCNQCHGEG
jgi:cytochrome c553